MVISHEYLVLGCQDGVSHGILESRDIERIGEYRSGRHGEFEFLLGIVDDLVHHGIRADRRIEFRSFESVGIYVFADIIAFGAHSLDAIEHLGDERQELVEIFRRRSADGGSGAICCSRHSPSRSLDELRMSRGKTSRCKQYRYDAVYRKASYHGRRTG